MNTSPPSTPSTATRGAVDASNTPVGVRNLSKVFFTGHEPVWAIDDLHLDVVDGSFTCILGPSGCGKSTLLRILGGLEEPTDGQVTLPPAAGKRPAAAFVFQDHGVFPWLPVLDNVAFGLHMAGVGRTEREATARDWLARVGLTAFEKAYPHQLSGGMRQRIAIARAFATGSPVLLMDEPLGALDAQTRLLMQEELVRLWESERKTVVLVTHGIEEAILLGDRVVVMSARPGRIKEDLVVPFERPRTTDLEGSREFAAMRAHIWDLLRDEVRAAEQAQ